MKIGILTQPLYSNYGGLLQNYALQQVLINAGHEVKTIDWYYNFNSKGTKRNEWIKTKILSRFNFFFREWHFLTENEKRSLIANPLLFKTTRINTTTTFFTKEEIESCVEKEQFDAYIVGSDQCWRPKYNRIFLETMFLDFHVKNDKVKKIAYAASFGTDKWEYSLIQTEKCAELVSQFNLVTVRELSGINLCEQYFHVKAQYVLDPTMLLDITAYLNIMQDSNKKPGTLTTYILDKNQLNDDYIKEVEKQTTLERYELNPAPFDYRCSKKNVSQYEKMSVSDWLSAIYHAKIVIVDSFHGAVFSILFHKSFWVICNKKRGATRFESLLGLFHLENRMVSIEDLSSVSLNSPIDWNSVDLILQRERQKSLSILLNALQNA